MEEEAKKNPLIRLKAGAEVDPVKQQQEQAENKLADGFVRSKRNQQLRVKGEILTQIQTLEQEKMDLIQKLNKALVKLDKLNSHKKEIGNKLLEQVKFVRDLQRAAANGDDIGGIVSIQMKSDFKREKELNARLQEELRRCEQERLRIMQRIKILTGEKEVVVQSSDGLQKTYKVTQLNLQNMIDELRENKSKVEGTEQLVMQSREMVRVADEELQL